MPAQWPLFINNVSTKLASRTIKTSDELAMFLADEYFNAVKTSQTPFGNMHSSGQKSVLEEGFKKAFKKLYEADSPTLADKLIDPKFEELKDEMPKKPLTVNLDKELEKCLKTKAPYTFFDFAFPSIGPTISKSEVVEKKYKDVELPKVVFKGFDGKAPYTFKYAINGVSQKPITTIGDLSSIEVEIDKGKPGTYEYTLISAKDASKRVKKFNSSVVVDVSSSEYDDVKIVETSTPAVPLKETDIVELIAKRIVFQYDGTEEFRRWVDRLEYGHNKALGKKVKDLVKYYFDKNIKSNVEFNKNKFQISHEDDKDNVHSIFTPTELICKFTYIQNKDALTKAEHIAITALSFEADKRERNVTFEKSILWIAERERYRTDRMDCMQKIADSFKKDEEKNDEDEYVTISKAIIAYWQSTLTKPFQPGPPIPPTMIPTPGTYIPVYYGSEKRLADNIRKALNVGKLSKLPPTLQPATKAVASALAVAFALHLLELKFIYVGQIYVGVSTAPMIGVVPAVF